MGFCLLELSRHAYIGYAMLCAPRTRLGAGTYVHSLFRGTHKPHALVVSCEAAMAVLALAPSHQNAYAGRWVHKLRPTSHH
jgi:hypothetical protein